MTRSTRFTYRAARKDGALELGSIEAASSDAATSVLSDQGLFPIEIHAEATGLIATRSIPPNDLALGLRMFASFLEAGLPLSRALGSLADVLPPSWSPLLEHVREEVRQGATLASAMRSAPTRVPPLIIGVIQAGEAGSGLAGAVRKAAELVERSVATRTAIRSAIAYPIILAIAGAASLALLVGIVLPRFTVILADLGQALPGSTRLVLAVADAMRVVLLPVIVVSIIAAILWRSWVETDAGRERWHSLLLALPLVGPVRASYSTARITAPLAALLDAGVPLAQALLHVGRAGGDAAIGARLLVARTAVTQGERLATALEREKVLTATATKLVRAGEETGTLSEMLAHASRIEDERAQQHVRSLVRLLEPLLIIGFGIIVAVVAAALLQAVYSVRPS